MFPDSRADLTCRPDGRAEASRSSRWPRRRLSVNPVLHHCPVVVSIRDRQDNVLVGRHAKLSSLRVGRCEPDTFIGDFFAARRVRCADMVGGRLRVPSHVDFIATCNGGPSVGSGEREMATVRPPLAPRNPFEAPRGSFWRTGSLWLALIENRQVSPDSRLG